MERYICIHGHFYQPPRENPWLEAVELQDSAYPYHDWNERVTAECYGPNTVARMLDGHGRIVQIVNNYAKISFNFGPTLLSWLETTTPEVYRAILAADQESQRRFSGHGSALAQAYNHIIMPLANRRDKLTQILWGLRDFEHRFGRKPEGMWLPETAVDLETLELLAEAGLGFTILAPHQAARVRKIGDQEWQDVSGGHVDPTRAYVHHLPSGRSLAVFFYDGPISRAVAFEMLLTRGEYLAGRLASAFQDARSWPQLVHIATDGETYGHHSAHGDMALAYALDQIETQGLARLTNYGEYLEKHPPTHEVEIIEYSSWSCPHGVERWRSDCGCNSGRAGWNQAWRRPLREALDWLRDQLAPLFESRAEPLLQSTWEARNRYVDLILDRSPESLERFLAEQADHGLAEAEVAAVLQLLEMQRHALLMYTSCGWFFDELSGLETVQVLEYAGRALQLAEGAAGASLETEFLERLEKARSNLPEHRDGKHIYEKFVKPTLLTWERLGAHYGVRSLFESYPEQTRLYCYTAHQEEFQGFEAGKTKLVVGRVLMTSEITHDSQLLAFGALHFGDHNVNCGVRKYQDAEGYQTLAAELSEAFGKADFPEIIRLFDRGFGESTYSLRTLFRDEQRKVMRQVLSASLAQAEAAYRRLYEDYLPTLRFLADLGVPLPRAFRTTAEFVLNTDLRWAFEDDEPNPEHIRKLFDEANLWHVTIDTPGLAYRFRATLGRMAARFREHPDDPALLQTLRGAVDLAHTLPFEVDLWQPQNTCFEVFHTTLPELEERAAEGDEAAGTWVTQFLALAETLNLHTEELKKKLGSAARRPSVANAVADVLAERRLPRATYRLQLNKHFTFRDAQALVPYLHELGISDCYTSPILKARPGSMHGYDVCDPTLIDPELCGAEAFEALAASLREHGMGLLVDTVPNHMGVNHESNVWWMDVLENGPSSVYASYFDIDWDPVNPDLKNKLLLPVLEDQYGTVLESGKIRLSHAEGAFFLQYHELKLPVAPQSYSLILEQPLPVLVELLGEADPHVQELRSILTAISYLPPRTETSPDRVAERMREKEIVKKRIGALVNASPQVRAAIEWALNAFNGQPGDRRSFDLLDRLLEAQAYRLAYWRVATEEINYRRFFDINELAAIRVERPDVFQATHQLLFDLLADGKVTGLRIDHCDGLWDPAAYFRQLQEEYLVRRVKAILGPEHCPEGFARDVTARFQGYLQRTGTARPRWPLFVVTEKILGENEPLPQDWPVYGTTGYDFLNAALGLFVNSAHRPAFDDLYRKFAGQADDFPSLVKSCQKVIMLVSMASEVLALSHMLDRISERNRRYRDFTLNSLTFALREVIAALSIYRTYITGPERVSLRDRMFIEKAVEEAKLLNPRTAEAVFDFIRDTLLLRNMSDFAEEDRPRLLEWTMKFQQLTGPVLAKGLEDTAFYIFNRLSALNEVGGHPEQFGLSVEQFHEHNLKQLQDWPHALLATTTHDTKRSEDVRARICVLSEMPEEWQAALTRWREWNAPKKLLVDGEPAPSCNDEYLLYQTLIGAWPIEELSPEAYGRFRERIAAYVQKATKEAKVHTSWINPNEEYDAAVRTFVQRLLPDDRDDAFLRDLEGFQRRTTFVGYFHSLSQLLLKLTCPGVPDIYQGQELWDLSLVDPDNRRPVDYGRRRKLLDELKQRIADAGRDLRPLAQELVAHLRDGRIKLFVLYRALNFRRKQPQLFGTASYEPLRVVGDRSRHVCAFSRSYGKRSMVVAVPRLVHELTSGQPQPPLRSVWKQTNLALPGEFARGTFRNIFTGEMLSPVSTREVWGLSVADVLGEFPVALLEHHPGR
jgi:(1->4)-alpha-D-glucan 1-alpha-D-glucosylmutase